MEAALRSGTLRTTSAARRVLWVAVLAISTVLMVAPLAFAQDPPQDRTPESPSGDRPDDGPRAGPPPKTGPPKSGVERPDLKEPPRDTNKDLLEAGGDLPVPPSPDAGEVSEASERFPAWRVAGMILSATVFGVALFWWIRLLER